MKVEVRQTGYDEIASMRDLYRQEVNCQIVCDSLLRRGLADAYMILANGKVAGYGGVRNRYEVGRLMEFYVLPRYRVDALDLFRALRAASGAVDMEAQTNMPLMLLMLFDCAENIVCENYLFEDAILTDLPNPGGIFRPTTPADHEPEEVGPFGIDIDGKIIASGGFLTHYNPPYGDIYMSVSEPMRQKGFGSYLVQELKRVCYEAGRRPAARCNADNRASRRTLERAGMLPCGRILVGTFPRAL